MRWELFVHRLVCKYWEWRLPKDMDEHRLNWEIKRNPGDTDFRFYMYMQKVNEFKEQWKKHTK